MGPDERRWTVTKRKGNYYGAVLQVKIHEGRLVIAIGVQTLAHAAAYAEWANPLTTIGDQDEYLRAFAITDTHDFAIDVARAMLEEQEDGSTPLSLFLDEMMQAACDDGSTACEYEQRIKHGETSPLETWAKGGGQ